jgi:hypothetical protein
MKPEFAKLKFSGAAIFQPVIRVVSLSNSKAADMELLSLASHPEPLWDSLIQRVLWVLPFGGKAGVSMNLTSHLLLGLRLRMRGTLSPCPLDASMERVLLGIDIIFVTDFIKLSLLTADSGGRKVQDTKYLRSFTH